MKRNNDDEKMKRVYTKTTICIYLKPTMTIPGILLGIQRHITYTALGIPGNKKI